MNILEEYLTYQDLIDPRDVPAEIKNFNLLIKNCDYILEKLNIVEYQEKQDIWKISDKTINETELMLKNLTSILNKITLDNYDLLLNEIRNFQVIEDSIIIDRAVYRLISNIKTNQVYCEVYSKLVSDINKLDLWFYKDESIKLNFINYLLKNLEKEFFNIIDIDIRLKELEDLKEIEDEDEQYEEESYLKKQKKGIILLICSLYNKNIVNNKIIEEIIRHLINPLYDNTVIPDEVNLELLSTLLNEINKNLIKNNFWNRSFCNEIKKSLNYLITDNRIKPKYKFIIEEPLKSIKNQKNF
jgi:hypothetical protein